MTSVLYAAVLSLLICYLAWQVIKARRANRVAYADGGVTELQIARSAHSNAVEYIPITLILLFALEYNGAPGWLVHAIGVLFVIGRITHALGILKERFKGRVLGMQITLLVILSLVAANAVYFPYSAI